MNGNSSVKKFGLYTIIIIPVVVMVFIFLLLCDKKNDALKFRNVKKEVLKWE